MVENDINRNISDFLPYALTSNDETTDHLETLFETKSLKNENVFVDSHERLNKLGKKINLFIQTIDKSLKR